MLLNIFINDLWNVIKYQRYLLTADIKILNAINSCCEMHCAIIQLNDSTHQQMFCTIYKILNQLFSLVCFLF